MPIEIDDNSIRIIGNDVEGIQFYDDDRTLRQSLSLNSDNELSISGTLETPTMDGDSVWQSATGVPVDIDTDGITIWTSGRNLNYIKYKFNDAGTARTQAVMYAVYNSALKAGEYWISSRRTTNDPWTYCVLHLSAYDAETGDNAALVLTTEYGTPRIDAACDAFNVQGDLLTVGGNPVSATHGLDAVLGNISGYGDAGILQCGWLGGSRQVFGHAASVGVWTEANITFANYYVSYYGGPLIRLNGTDEYLTLADAGWNEVSTYNLLAWWWVNTDDAAADQAIIGKSKSTNEQSWLMYEDNAAGWSFYVNGTGADADKKAVSSSHSITAERWTFVGVMYKPSTSIRIYVADITDTALTMDENTTSIPAALYNGTADLRLGATSTPAQYFDGSVGFGAVRVAGYSNIDTYVGAYLQRVFNMTKHLYGG